MSMINLLTISLNEKTETLYYNLGTGFQFQIREDLKDVLLGQLTKDKELERMDPELRELAIKGIRRGKA